MTAQDVVYSLCFFCERVWGQCVCEWQAESGFRHGPDHQWISRPNMNLHMSRYVHPEEHYGQPYLAWRERNPGWPRRRQGKSPLDQLRVELLDRAPREPVQPTEFAVSIGPTTRDIYTAFATEGRLTYRTPARRGTAEELRQRALEVVGVRDVTLENTQTAVITLTIRGHTRTMDTHERGQLEAFVTEHVRSVLPAGVRLIVRTLLTVDLLTEQLQHWLTQLEARHLPDDVTQDSINHFIYAHVSQGTLSPVTVRMDALTHCTVLSMHHAGRHYEYRWSTDNRRRSLI